jgi:hypothetical protein
MQTGHFSRSGATRRRHADRIDRMDAVKVSFTNLFADRREGFTLPSVWTVPAFEFGFAPENPSLTNRSRSARQSAHQSEVSSSCAIGQYRISSRIHSPIRLPSRDNPIGDGEIPLPAGFVAVHDKAVQRRNVHERRAARIERPGRLRQDAGFLNQVRKVRSNGLDGDARVDGGAFLEFRDPFLHPVLE